MSISTGFHATREEIYDFVLSVMEEYNLFVLLVKDSPTFEVKSASIIEIKCISEISYEYSIIIIRFNEMENDEELCEYNQFFRENADALVIQIGEYDHGYMTESAIGTRCTDLEKMKTWKRIIKKLKSQMKNDVWAINPHNNARAEYKSNYYSNNALELYNRGIVMKAFAGNVEYHFGEKTNMPENNY